MISNVLDYMADGLALLKLGYRADCAFLVAFMKLAIYQYYCRQENTYGIVMAFSIFLHVHTHAPDVYLFNFDFINLSITSLLTTYDEIYP